MNLIDQLKYKLNKYNEILSNLEKSTIECGIYDDCAELRRRIQLDTEKKIAEIKTKHNFDINTDESYLNSHLRSLIDSVNNQSDSMIAIVDKYEKDTCSLFKKNENKLPRVLREAKATSEHFVAHWQKCLADGEFEDNRMRVAVLKLNRYLRKLEEKVKKFNNNAILNLKQNETKNLSLSLYISFDHNYFVKSKEFNFQLVLRMLKLNYFLNTESNPLFDRKKRCTLIKLADGNYLIQFDDIQGNFIEFYSVFYSYLINNIIKKEKQEKKE